MSFWSINKNGDGGAELRIEGEIVTTQDIWDWLIGNPNAVAPMIVREIRAVDGPLTVWINSPGGSVFAASTIYTHLREHGNVTVKIDGEACSAASVIAMAGDRVLISPTAMMMIHNPLTAVEGDIHDMERAMQLLREAKEGIVNAYMQKTGMSADEISQLMDETTFMSADTAIRMGFADEKLFSDDEGKPDVSNLFASLNRTFATVNRVSNLDTAALRDVLQRQFEDKTDTIRANRLRLERARF